MYIVADVGVAAFGSAFVSPFLAILLARSGAMDPAGLLHAWFYAIPAELLAVGPWNVDLVFPISIGVYFIQYLVIYIGVAVIVRVAMMWMAKRPPWRA